MPFGTVAPGGRIGGQSGPLPHLRTTSPPPRVRRRAARATTRSPAGWTTRGPSAIDEADEVFPAERLGAQQAQIVRRLEALERPARVIAFPRSAHAGHQRSAADRSAGSPRPPPPASSSAWAPGELLDFRRSMQRRFRRTSRQSAVPLGQSARGTLQPVAFSSEDLFLYDDSDAASTSPSVEALQAARRADAARAGPGSGQVGSWRLPSL